MVYFGKQHSVVKTTINLAQKERSNQNVPSVIFTAIVLALLIALFCKFGVANRLNRTLEAENTAERAEQKLSSLQKQTANYDQVLQEYQNHTTEQSLTVGADPMECLTLIEDKLLGSAEISSFSVASDEIDVKLSGVTLQEVSSIYTNLTSSDLVSGVQVYTAATTAAKEKSARVAATMTIRLNTDTTTNEGAEEP